MARDNTPAHMLAEEDRLLEADRLLEKEQPAQPPEEEDKPSRPAAHRMYEKYAPEKKIGLIGALLGLLRYPEKVLIERYYRSSFSRRMREKFEWYRELEGERQVANKLQNAYGGTDNPFHQLAHFVRNNILVSLLVIGISAHLFVDYLSQPASNRYSDRDSAASVADRQEAPEPPVDTTSEALKVMNHCAVTDGMRTSYADAGDPALQDRLIEEVNGFLQVYSGSAIEQWYAEQEAKHDMVITHLRAALPRVSTYRDRVAGEITDTLRQQQELSDRLRQIAANETLSLADINKSIKLRTRLANVQARLEHGPSALTLAQLDGYLQRMEKALAGDLSSTTEVSYWAIEASEQSETELTKSVASIIDKDVYATIDQASQGAPEARAYRLKILAATMRHFGDLIAQLQNADNFFEAQVGTRQSRSNERIGHMLGRDTPAQFLNYDNCLTALNAANTTLSVQSSQ